MKISDEERKDLCDRLDGAWEHGGSEGAAEMICDLIERASGEGRQDSGPEGGE